MRRGHKPKLSLDKGLFIYSISLAKCSTIVFSLSTIIVHLVYKWEIALFIEGEEEVGTPIMVEQRFILWEVSPKGGNKKPKKGGRGYSVEPPRMTRP